MKKVSIIIPMYNSEKYIDKCLDSVLAQTYTNIEIILIDDGSSDNTLRKCEQYNLKDDRMIIISRQNKGVSYSRNEGIDRATGDYICFIDSDDYLSKEYVKQLVDKIKDSQMAVCGYTLKYINKEIIIGTDLNKTSFTKQEALNKIFDTKVFRGFLWNKIFKTSIIKENNLYFNNEISMCEDLLFVYKYINICNNIKYIPNSLYYYRIRKNGISSKEKVKYIDALNVYNEIIRLSKKSNHKFEQNFYVSLINLNISIMCSSKIEKSLRKEAKKYIKSNLKHVVKSKNLKFKIKVFLALCFPNVYNNMKTKNEKEYYD